MKIFLIYAIVNGFLVGMNNIIVLLLAEKIIIIGLETRYCSRIKDIYLVPINITSGLMEYKSSFKATSKSNRGPFAYISFSTTI